MFGSVMQGMYNVAKAASKAIKSKKTSRKIEYIFLHCTATSMKATPEAIKTFWHTPVGPEKKMPYIPNVQGGKGWKSVGYHRLISPNGKIHNLASYDKVTNGVRGYNSKSIHISYIGGIKIEDGKIIYVDNRTAEQRMSMYRIVKGLMEQYPNAKVLGHRDVYGKDPRKWQKTCPNFDVSEWLKDNKLL